MKINVSEIDESGIVFDVVKSPEWLDNVYDKNNDFNLISFDSDLFFELFVEKIVNEINLSGNVKFVIKTECSRCLVSVKEEKNIPLTLILSPSENEDSDEQIDDNFETYTGNSIDLSNYLKEQVALSLPFKVVCKEDCKGLCPSCGVNLNIDNCNCKNKWKDSRFSILKNIKV